MTRSLAEGARPRQRRVFAASNERASTPHKRASARRLRLRSPWQLLVLLPLCLLLLFLHLLLLGLFLVFLTTLVSHRLAPCSPLWLVAASASARRSRLGAR